MYDDNSAEVEVCDFLGALVLAVKPKLVVETGTRFGHAANAIANALESNRVGKLITCEKSEDFYNEAKQRLEWFDSVELRNVSSLDLIIEDKIDILFSDSDPAIRMKEVERFWPNLGYHSLILVHDVNTGCHRALREELLGWRDRLHVVFLPTPRGLAICQKR